MEGPARAGHDPGGGLRLEWPDFRQPVPDRQGDDGDQLERPSLLRASAGKSRRCGSGKGPPKGRGQRRRENSPWRIARKLAPMKNLTTKRGLRCAIYTRVSTDQGLEQDFNSLDAQREASEAYVKSQAHEGWRLVRDRYDDGGFSGGSMDRPALQKLLIDVQARRIDVIVVYKVDRLTRSLADFAKLVETFDGLRQDPRRPHAAVLCTAAQARRPLHPAPRRWFSTPTSGASQPDRAPPVAGSVPGLAARE